MLNEESIYLKLSLMLIMFQHPMFVFIKRIVIIDDNLGTTEFTGQF